MRSPLRRAFHFSVCRLRSALPRSRARAQRVKYQAAAPRIAITTTATTYIIVLLFWGSATCSSACFWIGAGAALFVGAGCACALAAAAAGGVDFFFAGGFESFLPRSFLA